MVDIDLLEQLVNSMNEAVGRLEAAHVSSDVDFINRLRVFIFNVQKQIDGLLNGALPLEQGKG